MGHMGAFFGKTCHERHDHQRFDGAPCGRDQWVLVGAVDSCTQGRQGQRITVSSIQIHTERVVDISMHTEIEVEALSESVHDVNICTRRTRQWTLVLAFLCHPSFLLNLRPHLLHARQECISQHPEPNPLFEVPSPSLCSPRCPSLPPPVGPSHLSAPLLPASCSCNQGHRHLHCPPLPHPHASTPGHITPATCVRHRALGPELQGFHPPLASPFRASHPLIPAPCH